MRQRRGSYVAGLVLIILGVLFLVEQLAPDTLGGWMFLLGLGLVLLIGYVLTRQYGYLIPGCIMTGLGIPVALVETNTVVGSDDGIIVLGLALGFLAIWLIDSIVARSRPAGWWPLIPGVILLLVAASILMEYEAWMQEIGLWWPVVLIAVGVFIILDRALRRRD